MSLAASIAVISSAHAQAPEPVKNGMPCIQGICIGDDIRNVTGIQWIDLLTIPGSKGALLRNKQLPPVELARIANALPAKDVSVAKALAPYLDTNSFDSFAIARLKEAGKLCWYTQMTGYFMSESGYQTAVRFAPVVKDDMTQVFEINWIQRNYTVDSSVAERSLATQVATGYAAVARSFSDRSMDSYYMKAAEIEATKAYWYYRSASSGPVLVVAKNERLIEREHEAKIKALPGCEVKAPSLN